MCEPIGVYWNVAGDYEYQDTEYTVLVYAPKRPARWLVSNVFRRDNKPAPRTSIIRERGDTGVGPTCFHLSHLEDTKSKVVKILSREFPAELRCQHLLEPGKHKCLKGCYFLEKGGDYCSKWRSCDRPDCEGHIYDGEVKRKSKAKWDDAEDDYVEEDRKEKWKGVACFGRRGHRMVCVIDRDGDHHPSCAPGSH